MSNIRSILLILLAGCMIIGTSCFAAETRTITDIAGNQVTLPMNVTKTVNIDPFTSQFLYIMGADKDLVATTFGPSNKDVLNVTEPYLMSLPSVGHKDNLNSEEVLKLKPDLVITSIDYPKSMVISEQIGVPFVLLDFENPENLTKSIHILGEIFGKEKEADEYISYYNDKMKTIEKDVAAVSSKKPIYFAQKKPMQTLGDDYYEADLAKIAGADNVAEGITGGDNIVSMDQIYTWNPETIILLPYCSANVSEILADPAWQSLPAVQNKQVYRMPKYLLTWEMPGPESVLGAMWLEKTLYPDKVSYDFNQEIKDFYQKFYGLKLTDDDVEAILQDRAPVLLTMEH